MALRISKKERQALYRANTRARRKQERLHTVYGKHITFQTRAPSSFTTRKELNEYKAELKHFNAPYTHKYVMGGVQSARRSGNLEQYNLAIPYRIASEIRRREKEWNRYVAKNYRNLAYTPYHIKGREQDMLAVHRVNPWYPKTTIPYKTLKEVSKRYHSYYTAKADFKEFHTTESINKYLTKLQRFMNPEHASKQLAQSKENYIKSLINTYGNYGIEIGDIIKQLTPTEWGNLYDTERFIDFKLHYSTDYNDRDLKGIAQGLLSYVYRNKKVLDKIPRADLEEVQEILGLSNVDILSEMNSNIETFTHNGIRYRVALRFSEIEDYNKYGVTPEILNRAEYVGREVPKYKHEKDADRRRRR